jgi:predicted nucleotidyltransferase
MLTREEITTILRENHAHLAAEYGVKRVGLFGSYTRNAPTEASDVDLIVEFERPTRSPEGHAQSRSRPFYNGIATTNPRHSRRPSQHWQPAPP